MTPALTTTAPIFNEAPLAPVKLAMATANASPSRRTYLFGTSIGNSLSPVFHNACYKARGLPGWDLSRIDSTDMDGFLKRVHADDFGGSAVTMPHKAAILRHVDAVDTQAKLIGAANTLYFKDGQLRATNTDVAGIRDSIKSALAPGEEVSSGSHIGLIVGGGGTTRTAVYTLRYELGCSAIYIINRLASEVDDIIADYASKGVHDIHHLSTPEAVAALPAAPRFIVNAIPCLPPQTDGERAARATLTALLARGGSDSSVFLEMCYFPHTWTDVCQLAKDNRFKVVQGMECMYHQAVAQQLLWLGQPPQGVDLLEVGRQAAENELAQRAAGSVPN